MRFGACILLGCLFAGGQASADETGLASIHDLRVEGGRLCMSDHYHDGTGQAASKARAEAAAVRSWSSFTAFEYGGSWGSFRNAASKNMQCSHSGGSWNCDANARPCRLGPVRAVHHGGHRARTAHAS
jgi:hypothetical protein